MRVLNSRFSLLLLPFLVLLPMAGCEQREEAPIPADTMQKLLLDVQYAEVYSMMVNDSLHQTRNKNKDSLAVYYQDIFAHYKISEKTYMEGLTWYKHHPEELDSIYTRMLPQVIKLDSSMKK